jgi:hypothetical protein
MSGRRKRGRGFGTVRRLPSGRWQVRYYDRAGTRHTAPRTFPSKADATRQLAQVEADLLRGVWTDPRLARITFGSGSSGGSRPPQTCGQARARSTTTCCVAFSCRPLERRRWASSTR